ncbi:alpha/beta fold hydrolase [Paludisphaera mucosa]|uniref:Alpha/beta hydrolase n=1 Tax=Paludisphaera mucosa TaxID=3030827 RepID=A0ABT6FJS5_9BACT|nr:alpha/beta hydrolase [Paludisphaera mucosa]MDG3007831.1 alpha/beta hydrolase [Paludisphaera mucosa]
MPFMPFQILGFWLRGLLAAAMLVAGPLLLKYWYDHRHVEVRTQVLAPVDDETRRLDRDVEAPVVVRREDWRFGLNRETAALLGGLALIGLSIGGGSFAYPLLLKRGRREDEPDDSLRGQMRRLRRPDGTDLYVELYGPEDGPPIVLTHGWGADAAEWCYAKRELGDAHRLILWDLPGLGRSSQPTGRDYSLEKMARDLDAVVGLAGDAPVTLLGHSIGGMIILTYCRLFPEALGTRVSGLVLAQTTYTNPVKTTSHAAFYTAVQKPLIEPLLHLTIALAPLVRAMNVLSYLNGSAHRSTHKDSFSGNETRGQLDFMARYMPKGPPAVLARGMFGMLRYDATDTLASIPVPALIVPGGRDPVLLPSASAKMAEAIPGATLLELEGAKHAGLFEYHARFADAVRRFVAATAVAPGSRR